MLYVLLLTPSCTLLLLTLLKFRSDSQNICRSTLWIQPWREWEKPKGSAISFASSSCNLWGRNSVWPPWALLCCWGVRTSSVLTCVKGEARLCHCPHSQSWVLLCEKGWPVLRWLAKVPSLLPSRPEPAPRSKHRAPCLQLRLILIKEFTGLLVGDELGV